MVSALVVVAALWRWLSGSVGRLVRRERGSREQRVPAVSALWEWQFVKTYLRTTQCQIVLETAAPLPQHYHQRTSESLTCLLSTHSNFNIVKSLGVYNDVIKLWVYLIFKCLFEVRLSSASDDSGFPLMQPLVTVAQVAFHVRIWYLAVYTIYPSSMWYLNKICIYNKTVNESNLYIIIF